MYNQLIQNYRHMMTWTKPDFINPLKSGQRTWAYEQLYCSPFQSYSLQNHLGSGSGSPRIRSKVCPVTRWTFRTAMLSYCRIVEARDKLLTSFRPTVKVFMLLGCCCCMLKMKDDAYTCEYQCLPPPCNAVCYNWKMNAAELELFAGTICFFHKDQTHLILFAWVLAASMQYKRIWHC
jgi:hypothetical protein